MLLWSATRSGLKLRRADFHMRAKLDLFLLALVPRGGKEKLGPQSEPKLSSSGANLAIISIQGSGVEGFCRVEG